LDLISFVCTLAGIALGFAPAVEYGLGFGLIGAVVGGLIGNQIGCIPHIVQIRKARRKMATLTVEQLRNQLHQWAYARLPSEGQTPNFLLAGIRARGEDISQYLGWVLDMLESESVLRRACGRGALWTGWPHLGEYLKGYSPERSVEECRRIVANLRQAAEID